MPSVGEEKRKKRYHLATLKKLGIGCTLLIPTLSSNNTPIRVLQKKTADKTAQKKESLTITTYRKYPSKQLY